MPEFGMFNTEQEIIFPEAFSVRSDEHNKDDGEPHTMVTMSFIKENGALLEIVMEGEWIEHLATDVIEHARGMCDKCVKRSAESKTPAHESRRSAYRCAIPSQED
jgi:hypothetical protein